MSLQIIAEESRNEENEIQLKINSNIDKFSSFLFESGAGAGKTYALIESLKYIVFNYKELLESNNQKIICITYTNVATEEVKLRLGNSSDILVSTIHERIWSLIKDYQKELVIIHKNNLEEQLKQLEKEYSENPIYIGSLENIREIERIANDNKDLFYKYRNSPAKDFRNEFCTKFDGLINSSNVSKVQKFISLIYKKNRYKKCIDNITTKKLGYDKVSYDSSFNIDKLDKMKFSHDTLLDYGLKIIGTYPILIQIIIDHYPFILIDEYQDTNEKVINIMAILDKFAKENNKKLVIGYFGDASQNIYEDGVGKKIKEIHKNLNLVKKNFNRRSTKEIINVINKIRTDGIYQESIYVDNTGGFVSFKETKDIDNEIKDTINDWKIDDSNNLNCLVLTNELLSQYCKFSTFYNCFKISKFYKNNYKQLNSELLSSDKLKLGEIQLFIFKIFKFLQNIKENSTPIYSLIHDNIPEEKYLELANYLTLKKITEFINISRDINGKTFGEILESIETHQHNNENEIYNIVIESIFDTINFSLKTFEDKIYNSLYNGIEKETDISKAKDNIQNLLNINIEEYHNWFNFITDNQKGIIKYHTYHGTKGLQFKNEIIIMQNKFGPNKNYFDFYFENLKNTLDSDKLAKFTKSQNLLYVACSRAIYNLKILYIDDISGFKNNIEYIFGEINN